MSKKVQCQECGQWVKPKEFHDYQKCLEFKLRALEAELMKLEQCEQWEHNRAEALEAELEAYKKASLQRTDREARLHRAEARIKELEDAIATFFFHKNKPQGDWVIGLDFKQIVQYMLKALSEPRAEAAETDLHLAKIHISVLEPKFKEAEARIKKAKDIVEWAIDTGEGRNPIMQKLYEVLKQNPPAKNPDDAPLARVVPQRAGTGIGHAVKLNDNTTLCGIRCEGWHFDGAFSSKNDCKRCWAVINKHPAKKEEG